jgi:hypothetical protein
MARFIFLLTVYYTLHVGINILIFFLAHLAKGNVGFWHHLASVICCLKIFLDIDQSETRIACGDHVC